MFIENIGFIIIVIVLLFIFIYSIKKSISNNSYKNRNIPNFHEIKYDYTNSNTYIYNHNKAYPASESAIKNKIFSNIKQFNEDNFKRFAEMVYVRYLASITAKDISLISDFLHEQMKKTHFGYISTITLANRKINIENIIVNRITLSEYKKENNVETIRVIMESQMNEYETDDKDMVISGYRSRILNKKEVLTFVRDYNSLYSGSSITCPHCLASLSDVAQICEYCGTAVKFDDKINEGWLLSDITKM